MWVRKRSAPPVVETHADSVRALAAAMLRTGLALGAVVAVAAIAVATAVGGWPGLYGAVVGVALGFVSSLATIGLMHLTAPLPVQALFGAVLGGYVIKIGLLMAVVAPLRAVTWLEPTALALSVLAVVFAWVGAEVMAFRRTPLPTIIPAQSR